MCGEIVPSGYGGSAGGAARSRHLLPSRDDILKSITLDCVAYAAVVGKDYAHAGAAARAALRVVDESA